MRMDLTARSGPCTGPWWFRWWRRWYLVATWPHHDHPAVLLLIAASLSAPSSPPCTTPRWSPTGRGEPFGSLILAVAVTVIEVGMIVMLMAGGGPGA